MLEVLTAGVLTTVQDHGRVGWAHLGVPRAGALDRPAADLANRLVGNPPGAAVLETVLGGLVLRNRGPGRWAALTGASGPEVRWWPSGGELRVAAPATGVRTYLAVAGGVAVEPVLGSRSTDTLAWVGPSRVVDGALLPLGAPVGEPSPLDVPRTPRLEALRIVAGPRADWFAPDALDRLCATTWTVQADSDRVGLRLAGPPLERARSGELPSEGMVLGAVQVPPDGQPVVFLADHPPTGGYPVLGVVHPADLWWCAQRRPGDAVRLRRAPVAPRG
ncbi:MAG TPA: biotin-dependent carboxyltransferase family protein [Nocardioides sp.]|uniref:5-oxoprolinase subunit C family protein n=1 Tax=Nocardioides sp. TaxID=35761 RepID=UPI002EDB835A